MAKIYATCKLCTNFDANRSFCMLSGENVDPMKYEQPSECQKNGQFMRNLNVIPDGEHFFPNGEGMPPRWEPDFSRLPIDKEGVPLFVRTRRGYERAIPADPSITLEGDLLVGVRLITTFQGQREIIHDLGAELAQREADKQGVPLHILPEETNWPGIPKLKQAYLHKQGRLRNPQTQWLSEEPIESW